MKLQRDRLKQYQKNVCTWLHLFLLYTRILHRLRLDVRSKECCTVNMRSPNSTLQMDTRTEHLSLYDNESTRKHY